MSCVVAGRVMARWHLPLWCFWNAAVAFFQLQNPLMIYNIVCSHVQWTIIKINYNSSVTYKGWFHIFLSHFILPKCSHICMAEYRTICFVVMQKAVLLEQRSLTRTHCFFQMSASGKKSISWLMGVNSGRETSEPYHVNLTHWSSRKRPTPRDAATVQVCFDQLIIIASHKPRTDIHIVFVHSIQMNQHLPLKQLELYKQRTRQLVVA